MRRLFLILLLCITCPTQALLAPAMLPDEIVKTTSKRLLGVLKKDGERLSNSHQDMRRLLNEILLPMIDFDAFSKLALGRNWRKASSDQRQRFTQELKSMLIRTYTKYLVDYSSAQVTILPKKGTRRDPRRQIVFTELAQPGKPPLAVNWSFWLNDGVWKAWNVSVDGLSLVHLFRTDFDREINQTSLDALIKRLAKTNVEFTHDLAAKQAGTR